MPRFRFDLIDDDRTISDPEGLEVPDVDAAKREAVRALAEIVKDALPDGRLSRDLVPG